MAKQEIPTRYFAFIRQEDIWENTHSIEIITCANVEYNRVPAQLNSSNQKRVGEMMTILFMGCCENLDESVSKDECFFFS